MPKSGEWFVMKIVCFSGAVECLRLKGLGRSRILAECSAPTDYILRLEAVTGIPFDGLEFTQSNQASDKKVRRHHRAPHCSSDSADSPDVMFVYDSVTIQPGQTN